MHVLLDAFTRAVRAERRGADVWLPLAVLYKRALSSARSLEQSVQGVSVRPADISSYLYLTEHHRRVTIASLELFREAVEVRLPFVDAGFLGVLLRGRPEWRAGTSIHRALTTAARQRSVVSPL